MGSQKAFAQIARVWVLMVAEATISESHLANDVAVVLPTLGAAKEGQAGSSTVLDGDGHCSRVNSLSSTLDMKQKNTRGSKMDSQHPSPNLLEASLPALSVNQGRANHEVQTVN